MCSRSNLRSLVGLCVFLLSAAGSVDRNETKTATPGETEPSLFVSANELFSAYEQNEIRADELYKNHYIEVHGQVSKIGKDILDTPYITFASRGHILSVQCLFAKPAPKWMADVSPGLSLSLVCKGNGKMGNVLLDECRAGSIGFTGK